MNCHRWGAKWVLAISLFGILLLRSGMAPAQGPIGATPAWNQGAAPVGLTSKEYLQLMAQINEARAAGSSTAVVPPPTTFVEPPIVPPATHRIPVSSSTVAARNATSVQPFVQESAPATPPMRTPSSPVIDGYGKATPTISAEYQSVWFRRQGDENTSYSRGGPMGPFGEDWGNAYRIGWYANSMERYEFAFLGTLDWQRSQVGAGPVDSWMTADPNQSNWLDPFNQATSHLQSQSARFLSFELNHRWITDDLGNYFVGFHAIDYQEVYRLESEGLSNQGILSMDTHNLLAGVQGGLELWRPISQRMAIGGQGTVGLYGNFAEGGWNVDGGGSGQLGRGDDAFQTAATFGLDAKMRYQVTTRLNLFASYRWWYLAGLATIDDQASGPLGAANPWILSTDAGFLLQGATCGLEVVF